MYFQHSNEIWTDFPELVPGVLHVEGITAEAATDEPIARFNAIAQSRLATASESELPEIQAWRRTFAKMGLKPTQYRCASESLLRRFKKEGSLPPIHPLIDICNAISLAYAIPIAVFDTSSIKGHIEVRYATGEETYLTFSGEVENPEPREVIFADEAGQAHARRWTNRQSGLSAIRSTTRSALIVSEALHESAFSDVQQLIATVADELNAAWSVVPKTTVLSQSAPRFDF
ncbi:DNA/RNA-binding domain of Phe-tRNA-synthetase-like protein [Allocatelliglobosispora scoriae]|uniref:DNA/RNA-binding domain of Phe-tRNA-synthetase-like protein n=1 Tax=Allocatelliglobosispora scoriae TaxID=643052 RepID=A0A841BI01_9ACTN|nr:phenylalanine--tRNA ligase beta subunit-related protein [Allocatelliglobosispora scoriae]MBB5868737.1 DNA/RNA-binding domain of Phe-tRNA-synthetase-like protein [Allocatelliglobosispora scoriae]